MTKNHKTFSKFFCLSFLMLTSVVFEAKAESYVKADTISPALLDPPFQPNSVEFKNDIKTIIKLQKDLNIDELDRAFIERHAKPEMVIRAVNPEMTRETNPKLYRLLDNASDTSLLASRAAKDYWKTKRPFLMDKNIQAIIEVNGFAYPSGHTCDSYVLAHILGLLIPEKRAEFQSRANKIAWRRVLVGVHYPKDLEGGRQLALITVGAMMVNPDFQEDFKDAQEELAKK